MSSIPSASGQDAHGPSATWVGLTSQEAETRLSEYGSNDPASTRRGALAFELLHLFLNPLVIILLVASVISAFSARRLKQSSFLSLSYSASPSISFKLIDRNAQFADCRNM